MPPFQEYINLPSPNRGFEGVDNAHYVLANLLKINIVYITKF